MRASFRTLFVAAAVSAVLFAAGAQAQTSRSGGGGGGQSAQAAAQLQQMAVERNALQSQVERLKQEVATAQAAAAKAEAQLGALRSRAAAAESKVKTAESGKETAEQAGTRLQARLDDVLGRLKQTAETLKTTDTERADLADRFAALTRAQNTCVDNNAALYLVATEVIDRYEGLGLGSALARSEPFTRLARTRAENAADAYRDRITALREKAAADRASATPTKR
jgi:chromosome segregation ATPase